MKSVKFIPLLLLSLGVSSACLADASNFACPAPGEIQSTDFSVPSIWIAPPMPHSVKDVVGVGLGGKNAKQLLGVEAYKVNHKPGWVCVYESEGGTSFDEYRSKLINVANSNHYLKRYVADITAAFEHAEPFLEKYSKDKRLGFIAYQKK